MGSRPCCAKPTHIAAPSRYPVGEFFAFIARWISLWNEHGPWAVCYYAASLYAYGSGYLPSAWDWAAQYLVASAPPLFDGTFGAAHASNPAVPPASTQEEVETDPKPQVNLIPIAPAPSGDLLNGHRHPATRQSSPGYSSMPIPWVYPTIPPRPLHRPSQPREGYSCSGPRTMPQDSPAPPPTRESASRHRGKIHTNRPSPSPAPRDAPPILKNAIAPPDSLGVIAIHLQTVVPNPLPTCVPQSPPRRRTMTGINDGATNKKILFFV